MMNFCTLFDCFYLDKAMALYHSLESVTKDFHIFLFCFDEKSYEIVRQLGWEHATVLSYTVIEDETLKRLKKERSRAEYCWTCTPVIIEYVLKTYPVESCTYIDADLYFFNAPEILFHEIKDSNADVVIVEHRFKKDRNYKKNIHKAGKYCVEFNFFNQTKNAHSVLMWWKEKCIEWCYYKIEPDRMGDQKYLEKFQELFENVHELQHLGGGVAPWNLNQYRLYDKEKCLQLEDISTGKKFDLVFYHFQNLRYLTDNIVNIKSQTHDRELKYRIYIPYLKELKRNEKLLAQKFGVILERRKKYSNNIVNTFLQKYIVVLKITSLSDIINLKGFDNCY